MNAFDNTVPGFDANCVPRATPATTPERREKADPARLPARLTLDLSNDDQDGAIAFTSADPRVLNTPLGDSMITENNASATNFSNAFFGCTKLAINPTIFYPVGGGPGRFVGKTVDLSYCFARAGYTGAQGIAPDLWACTFGSVTSTGCFSGAGNSSAGIKWRFFDAGDDGWQVSTYPQVQSRFPVAGSALADSGVSYLLPLEFAHKVGDWGVNFDVGRWLRPAGQQDAWIGGIALGRELSGGLEVVGEVHDEAEVHTGRSEVTLNFGARWKWSERVTLLVAAGTDLHITGATITWSGGNLSQVLLTPAGGAGQSVWSGSSAPNGTLSLPTAGWPVIPYNLTTTSDMSFRFEGTAGTSIKVSLTFQESVGGTTCSITSP